MPGVRLKRGQLRRRWCQMKGFESDFDAVLLVGFHAKAGNADAILSHTWITSFLDVRVNGQSVPEPSLNTWLAGAFGVPVVMLSGDDQVIAEASPVMGDIHYAQLKKSTGYFSGEHLPLDESRRLLRETARDAVRDAAALHARPGRAPVTIELDLSPDAVEATRSARGRGQPAVRRPRLGRRAAQRRRPRARDAPGHDLAEAGHDRVHLRGLPDGLRDAALDPRRGLRARHREPHRRRRRAGRVRAPGPRRPHRRPLGDGARRGRGRPPEGRALGISTRPVGLVRGDQRGLAAERAGRAERRDGREHLEDADVGVLERPRRPAM